MTIEANHSQVPTVNDTTAGRLSASVSAFFCIAANRALIGLGLWPKIDGWRRTAGVALRTPATHFVLSSFGLNLWSDKPDADLTTINRESAEAHFTHRIGEYLKVQPRTHFSLGGDETFSSPRKLMHVEVLRLGLGQSVPTTFRGCCISFVEPLDADAPERFVVPFFDRPIRGNGALQMICRLSTDFRSIDIWMDVHHVVADGVPMQEFLSGLECFWGRQTTTFPTPEQFAPLVAPAICDEKTGRHLIQDFVSLEPQLALRSELNRTLSHSNAGTATVGALFIWCLAHQPEFSGMKFAMTVELPATRYLKRGIGFISIRPEDYFGTGDRFGRFEAFIRQFNRAVALTRRRDSKVVRSIDAMSHTPAKLHRKLLELNPAATNDVFGTIGLTILRDASVFMAPSTDLGFPNGFMAMGCATLPSRDGRRVASITVKGAREQIVGYLPALRRAIAGCVEYTGRAPA